MWRRGASFGLFMLFAVAAPIFWVWLHQYEIVEGGLRALD
jgi:hypothetical protein